MPNALPVNFNDARVVKAGMAVLLLALLWLWAAFFLWQPPVVTGTIGSSVATDSPGSTPKQASSFNLFGQPHNPSAAESAPVSQLELRLTGTMAAANPAKGLAYIDNKQGRQKAFRVGERVFDMAELVAIYPDYVLLRHNGREEKITLANPAEFSRPRAAKAQRQATTVPGIRQHSAARPSRAQQVRNDEIRQKYLVNPQEIAKNIKVVPLTDGKGLAGLRVSALRQGNVLLKAGLKSNDLITGINGKAISPTNMMALMKELEGASQVSLAIRRNGRPQTVRVDLNSLKQ
jgi:type II secretion system protein C